MAPEKRDQKQPQQLPPLRKKGQDAPGDDEGIPPWMATFADMVTLLLCFFVLLLSFTTQDVNNFKILMGSVSEALGVQKEDHSAISAAYAETRLKFEDRQANNKEMVEVGERLKDFIRSRDLKSIARVSREKSGVMYRVDGNALFHSGDATIRKEAEPVLWGVVDSMHHSTMNLIIRGHTDSENLSQSVYDSEWELSAARAAACLRWLINHSDIPANRLKAVGYANAKPLYPSNSEENIRKNRRVEFFFVPSDNRAW